MLWPLLTSRPFYTQRLPYDSQESAGAFGGRDKGRQPSRHKTNQGVSKWLVGHIGVPPDLWTLRG